MVFVLFVCDSWQAPRNDGRISACFQQTSVGRAGLPFKLSVFFANVALCILSYHLSERPFISIERGGGSWLEQTMVITLRVYVIQLVSWLITICSMSCLDTLISSLMGHSDRHEIKQKGRCSVPWITVRCKYNRKLSTTLLRGEDGLEALGH